jgi:hypothetical protein
MKGCLVRKRITNSQFLDDSKKKRNEVDVEKLFIGKSSYYERFKFPEIQSLVIVQVHSCK